MNSNTQNEYLSDDKVYQFIKNEGMKNFMKRCM